MKAEKLVRMANQIAGFFRSYPDDRAAAGIADHITAFWTPAMRQTLLADAGDTLDPLVRKALLQLGNGAQSPVHKETAGPQEVGELGSDAG